MLAPLSILALWSLRDFALSHIAWLLLLLPATLLIPGMPAALLAFVRTTIGKILIAMVLAATLGWEARASLDKSAATRAALAVSEARAKEAEREATAARNDTIAATMRQAASETRAHHLDEELDAYAEDLAKDDLAKSDIAKRRTPAGCRLSERDARRLRGFGARP